ncbi:hypothetical protein V2G26_001679 [Clonostachys chloroleuca]
MTCTIPLTKPHHTLPPGHPLPLQSRGLPVPAAVHLAHPPLRLAARPPLPAAQRRQPGGWLAAYGPTTAAAWEQAVPTPQFVAGVTVFYLGLAGNYFHDEELREIRRRESRKGNAAAKHYRIPQAGLFKYMLFPHYFCEWVEWFGFWMACGWGCVPALTFLINEFTTMLPRAVSGKRWYAEKFGEEKVAKKWAVIPGVW